MKNNHLTSFEVSGFKKFTDLKIDNIGRFNLIVGDNNVGKTSLLEALTMGNLINETVAGLVSCLIRRKLAFTNIENNILKTYFQNVGEQTIQYSLHQNEIENKFTLSTIETSTLDKNLQNQLNLDNIGNKPYQFTVQLKNLSQDRTEHMFLQSKNISVGNGYMPFIFYNAGIENDLIEMYSDLVQENKQNKIDLLDNLKILLPDIENLEISSGTNLSPTFLITLNNEDKPFILNNFGDGTIKFFRYLLEIKVCKNLRLMIDEIDTGIHYSKIKIFLKAVISLSIQNNVQIFATTHSKECIQCFTEALEELNLQNEGRIIRLAETKSGIKAYTMQFEEFENALDAESEIR